MEKEKENHLLNLKVMRLSKPNIPTINPILCEKDDLAYEPMGLGGSASANSGSGTPTTTTTTASPGSSSPTIAQQLPLSSNTGTNGIEGLGLTSMLQLQSGVIYLGEVFCCYISLNNHSPYQVSEVYLKVELQTTSQRICLLDSEKNPVPSFSPGFSSDFVVQREVKESGINILVCAVNYTSPEGEQKKFRKYFKFQVMNPLVLKTRIHNLPNIIFLEACLENATQGSLFIESIVFDPIELFTSKDISFEKSLVDNNTDNNNNNNNNNNNSNIDNIDNIIDNSNLLSKIKISNDVVFLKQGSSRQYLFQIIPKDPNNSETKLSATLGRLDITWRSYFGEIGKLKTAGIQRKLSNEDIEVTLINIPQSIKLERPFIVTAKLINKSNRTLYPQFVLIRNKMDGIKINSHLPKIEPISPNSQICVNVEMFPLKPGMQQINGLAIKLIDPPIQQLAQNQITPQLVQQQQQQQQQQQPLPQQPNQLPQQQQPFKNYYEFSGSDIFVEFEDEKLVDI